HFLVGFLVGSAFLTLRTAFGRRQFFIRPQAPGGRIRALGYAPIRRGGRSALPRYARSGECHNCRVMGAPNRRVAEASATARPSLCEESQAGGCPRPALEV